MPKEKKKVNCLHCGAEFTQKRKDQKYCCAQHRFDHFFENRENEQVRLNTENVALQKENEENKATIRELTAKLQAAQMATVVTAPKNGKRPPNKSEGPKDSHSKGAHQ